MNRKRAIVLLGPPAVGKGSIATILASFGYKVVTMSDILREKMNSDIGFKNNFMGIVSSGQLVPDKFILEVLFGKIGQYNGSNIVLDGCTRTLAQTDAVYDWLIKNGYDTRFLYLEAPEDVCIKRMGIRTNELVSNGYTPREDDQDEQAKRNRLKQFYGHIGEIFSSRANTILRVNANRPKVDVVIDVLQQLKYRNFL